MVPCRQTFEIHPCYNYLIHPQSTKQGISILSSTALLCSRFSDPFLIMRYMIRVWKFKYFNKNPNYVLKIAILFMIKIFNGKPQLKIYFTNKLDICD